MRHRRPIVSTRIRRRAAPRESGSSPWRPLPESPCWPPLSPDVRAKGATPQKVTGRGLWPPDAAGFNRRGGKLIRARRGGSLFEPPTATHRRRRHPPDSTPSARPREQATSLRPGASGTLHMRRALQGLSYPDRQPRCRRPILRQTSWPRFQQRNYGSQCAGFSTFGPFAMLQCSSISGGGGLRGEAAKSLLPPPKAAVRSISLQCL
jgi:hypothetical protein